MPACGLSVPLLPRSAALVALAALAACTPEDVAPTPPSPLALDAQQRTTPLVCPGAPTCTTATGPLYVGAAARSITPTLERWTDGDGDGRYDEGEAFEDLDGDGVWDPVWLAGFGLGRPARELHDDCGRARWCWRRASCAWAWSRSTPSATSTTAWCACAWPRWPGASTSIRWSWPAPTSTRGKTPWGCGAPRRCRARSTRRTWRAWRPPAVDALEAALGALHEVSITVARGGAPELVSDSRLPEVVDDTFTLVRFDDLAGTTRATWTIWGNHPEALGGDNRAITSDYPHQLRERLEAEYPGSTAVFSAGSLGGLMNPLDIVGCPDADGRATCVPGDFALADYVGRGLGERAIAALRSPAIAHLAQPSLTVRRQPFVLPTGNLSFATALALGVFDRRMFHPEGDAWSPAELAGLTVADALEGRALLESEVGLLTLGPLEILFVPGELYPELWLSRDGGGSWVEHPDGADFPDAPLGATPGRGALAHRAAHHREPGQRLAGLRHPARPVRPGGAVHLRPYVGAVRGGRVQRPGHGGGDRAGRGGDDASVSGEAAFVYLG
jgi:hypothetical protein